MLATVRDYYKILGVGQDADKKAIKAAYRRLARRYHPDVAPGQDTANRFIEIREAYEVLSNPTRRRLYDRATRGRRQRAATAPKRRPRIPNTEYVLSVVIGRLGLRLSADVGGIGFVTGRRGSRRDPKDDE